MSAPLCIVVGYGAGVGHGIALAFGKAGFRVGLIARDPARHVSPLAELAAAGVETVIRPADIADQASLSAAIRACAGAEPVAVLVYNAVAATYGPPSTLAPSQLDNDLRVDVVGALVAVQAVLPAMNQQRSGTLLFTGGGWAHYPSAVGTSVGIGKAALRSLALVLAEELTGTGLRVGLVSVMGTVTSGTAFDPLTIGEAFLAVHRRPDGPHDTETFIRE